MLLLILSDIIRNSELERPWLIPNSDSKIGSNGLKTPRERKLYNTISIKIKMGPM